MNREEKKTLFRLLIIIALALVQRLDAKKSMRVELEGDVRTIAAELGFKV